MTNWLRLVALRVSFVLSIVAWPARAQAPGTATDYDFYARGPYRTEVPRPHDLLGYVAGAKHTQYAAQQGVLSAMMAAAGDRVRSEVIGTTEEGREMRILLLSSPANLARLDAIQAGLERLADPRRTTPIEAERLAAELPAVVMLSYSIHGNEPAGFEAAMWVAYHFLASGEPETLAMLDSTLIVINPSANPDGHERFAVWYNSLSVGTDEPSAYEWREPWGIWGRYGHYRFDMNRDMIALSHAPMRAALDVMLRWRPQVVVDHHSTTEQFFFPPVAEAINKNLPGRTVQWFDTFGRGNAAAFDLFGWQYYVRYVFDFFYPGYFDVTPTMKGAIGMTYETDGGKALARRREDRTVITFADGIAHHVVASLATVQTATVNRSRLLRDYHAFQRESMELGRERMKRVVIEPNADPTNAARVAYLLLKQGIEVRRLAAAYTSQSAHRYLAGPNAASGRRDFAPGALVIDLGQPLGRHAKMLLEPNAAFDSAFARDQIAKFQRNLRRGKSASLEDYDFYDVTAWSMPLTFGLDAYWTEDAPRVDAEPLTLGAEGDPVRALAPRGSVPERARSAYVFPNDRQAAAELAMALLREGFVLNVSTEPLRADGRQFPRGTFVARTSRNPERLHDRIAAMATEVGVPVAAIQSAYPDSGAVGVGSEQVRLVSAPRIVVAAGEGISTTSYGYLWHFLETEMRQPFVPVSLASIESMSTLTDYNVLIIPSGASGTIRRLLGSAGIERLKQWVRDGGVLIAYDGAAVVPGHKDVGLSSVATPDGDEKAEGDSADSLPSGPELTPPLASPTADPKRFGSLPGTIFKATLDKSHWLTLGYAQSELAVMLSGSAPLMPSKEGDNPVAFVGDGLVLSGFVWPTTEEQLGKTVWAATERHGRGHVVMMADDPLFRGFWRGTARLLTNAILFGPSR